MALALRGACTRGSEITARLEGELPLHRPSASLALTEKAGIRRSSALMRSPYRDHEAIAGQRQLLHLKKRDRERLINTFENQLGQYEKGMCVSRGDRSNNRATLKGVIGQLVHRPDLEIQRELSFVGQERSRKYRRAAVRRLPPTIAKERQS